MKECLDSIVNQEYTNLDIIIVNDGSTDNSLKICQDYSERDPRINLIDQSNQGRSTACNVRIEAAQGSCIAFVDQDDYIWPNYIRNLHQQICLDKVDMAICDYGVFYTDHEKLNVYGPNRHQYIGNYSRKEWLENSGSFYLKHWRSMCNPLGQTF